MKNNVLLSPNSDFMNLFATTDYVAKVNSVDVAKYLGVEHKNMLQTIDSIFKKNSGWSKEFSRLNFQPSKYKDSRGKYQRCFDLTQYGVMIIFMSYKSKKANEVKEKFIKAFDAMYNYIVKLKSSKESFPMLGQSIQSNFSQSEIESDKYIYSKEVNLMYMVVLGHNAEKIRRDKGLEKGEPIKEHLTAEQNEQLDYCQRTDCTLLDMGIKDYHARKDKLIELFNKKFGNPIICIN